MRIKKAPQLPKKSKTISNKIRRDDPWGLGQSLADLIDKIYGELIGLTQQDREDVWIHQVANLTEVAEWSEKHHLAPYHVVSTLVENYL